jgi:carboxyl-terminal processing protease
MSLTRAAMQYPKVTDKLLADQIGHIQVPAMTAGTAAEVATAVRSLERQGAKKLLLDVRYCGTGTPEEGIALANLFQDKGIVTYVQGQRYQRQDFQADPAKAITKLPVVVLTNRGTAGGSEIAAAALLDSKRAQVVGERSYGDAAIRQAITMDDGGAIILSVAKYYSPGGKAIQDTGVTPTVPVAEAEPLVDLDEDNTPDVEPAPEKPNEDPILKKGIEVLIKGVPPEAAQQSVRPPEDRTEGPERRIPPNVMQPNTPSQVPAAPGK